MRASKVQENNNDFRQVEQSTEPPATASPDAEQRPKVVLLLTRYQPTKDNE